MKAVEAGGASGAAMSLVNKILSVGIDGAGPMKGAREVADEHLAQHVDPDVAIERLIRTHTRLVGVSGFATGVGGISTAAMTIPADVVAFYACTARCAAAVAHLRGYDIDSDEVRSMVLLTLLGSAGAAVLAEVGAQIGTKTAMAALKKLPGSVLIEINKKVGFRLLTKFGEKGAINLAKLVPLAGGVVGATVNVAGIRVIGAYAQKNFPKT